MTPDALKKHYGEAEFEAYADDHLANALARADLTIDRYIQVRPSSMADAISGIQLTLARAYAHDEQSLGEEHPVVREMGEAMDWLRRVAEGRIQIDETTPQGHKLNASATVTQATVFTTDKLARMWP
jgi:hypothetical protein